jgi:hypothetical protein
VITVLVVGDRDRAQQLDAVAARNPSVELLHATDVEDALDRLARNRRIDAVLLSDDPETARGIAAMLLEEDPAGPPLFLAAASGAIAGVRPLPAGSPEDLLEAITRELRASG